MRYDQFEVIISSARMNRYLEACSGNTKKSMTLYRLNLKLSQEFFTVISCFEIALRNKINKLMLERFGDDWLKYGASQKAVFNNAGSSLTKSTIDSAIKKLGDSYTNNQLVAELGFGFWRYLFAQKQFNATGKILLKIFPAKPRSTSSNQYNQNFVFNQLAQLNRFRNRIAHHEPICFLSSKAIKDSTFARQQYVNVMQLFQWMNINESELLYGLDHIDKVCDKLDSL